MAPHNKPFVHLHVHSQYSLLDGACRTADLVKRAKELDQPAIAVTDHGCLFGVIDFYNKAKDAGVKPLVGIEAYMAPGARTDRTTTGVKDGGYHLLLLAQNREGYQNLLKLSSIAFTEGFYYKPRIDKEVLRRHSQGLVATSACLGGEIPSALMQDNRKKAREIAELYVSVFGPDRFFIEVQKHVAEQDKVNPELIDLADKLGVGIVATNDVHFLLEDDHAPHDALCCISTGKLISDESRMRYPTQLFLKSGEQMYAASEHPRWPQACENTVRIAKMCDLTLDFKKSYAPVVKIEKLSSESLSSVQRPVSSVPEADKKPRAHSAVKSTSSTLDTGHWTLDNFPTGTTEWFAAFCSQFQLQPFDELKDKDITPDTLNAQCNDALRSLAEAGLIWRYGDAITDEHRARLERELKVLGDKKISAYFLIVWDFVNEARRRGIPAMARGSGVGTMVGYCLGLSNACPVKYGLLFERFTDPDRSEYPDIDIDICQDGRQEILDYVKQKYGHVAQIITFGTLKARAALRDVGRVMNVPLSEVDKVCKLVGEALGTTIDQALQQEPDLEKLYQENPTHRRMIDTAKRLEGLARHAGVHAAGVVIATQPLDNIIPLYRPPGTDQLVTQWDGPTVEKIGLLKMDFLGLRTLSIIERAKTLIKQTLTPEMIHATVQGNAGKSSVEVSGHSKDAKPRAAKSEIRNPKSEILPDPLDLDRITYEDQNVLDLFRRGETAGVFQFESGGMRNTLMGMKPDRLEDLIAANALFRPGPMDLIPDYNDRKQGRKPVPKDHPIVEKYTAETYGIMVYQEQVMQIVHGLGSIPLRAAYTLIKNISKKKQKDIDAVRPTFVAGAQQQGLSAKQAEELFELILKFAGYGFNKSHSTGYAIIAYQTAYLKTYFPVQYMAAVLTYESVSIDKVVEYIDECRRVLFPDGHRGIEVRPPDINLSEVGFTVVYADGEPHDANHGHIRFGLSAVKGVGDKAIAAIINTRQAGAPFASLHDFCERVPLGAVNRATIEALIKCGAFDSVHSTKDRAAMVEALDGAIQAGQMLAADRDSGQMSFFEAFAAADKPQAGGKGAAGKAPTPGAGAGANLPRVAPWTDAQMLDFEKSVLGFYASAHPLDQHRDALARFGNVNAAEVKTLRADTQIIIGGMLTRVRPTVVKNGRSAGQKMAMITLEDATGAIDGVIFSDSYAVAAPLVQPDKIVFLKGKVDRRREEPNIVVDQIIPIEQAAAQLAQAVEIVLSDMEPIAAATATTARTYNGELLRLQDLLRQSSAGRNGGNTAQVYLELHQAGTVIKLRVNGLRVQVDPELPQRIATVLHSPGCCRLTGPARLLQGAAATVLIHRDDAPRQAMLARATTGEDEFCESIDRY